MLLFFSIFMAGFTIGIFATLKIFAPEMKEEAWDQQHFPQVKPENVLADKPSFERPQFEPVG